ncbi:Alpha beta hydrolase [Aspergillus sp. HF37]|nr:Alpha beta hydrolase [Aspergillus sp. HF37]
MSGNTLYDAHKSGSTEGSSSNWDADEKPREGLVCSDHGAQLFLAANGAQRKPGQPVIVFESGLGVSSACWAAVQRLLDGRIRSYRYDRAGYGHSPASETPRTAQRLASEQLGMLQTAGVSPPYILVAHSYGAIISRELVAAAGTDAIAGIVLVDANQENTQTQLRQPFPAIQGLTGGGDYFDLIGLKRENGYTIEELGRIAMDDSVPTGKTTGEKEGALMLDSSIALAAKGQLETRSLGMHPVTIIRGDAGRDFRRLLAATQDKPGVGEHVQAVNDFLDNRFDVFDRDLQMQQLRLSGNGRFVQATDSGHVVMATEPQLVADEILRVWESNLATE